MFIVWNGSLLCAEGFPEHGKISAHDLLIPVKRHCAIWSGDTGIQFIDRRAGFTGEHNGVRYALTSCDSLDFTLLELPIPAYLI